VSQRRVVLSDDALEDLADIWTYIALDDPSKATDYVQFVRSRIGLLVDYPAAGRDRDDVAPKVRSLTVSSHLVLYRVTPTEIQVLRIVSGRRNLRQLLGG
jgi:toxin ParE1/3/4